MKHRSSVAAVARRLVALALFLELATASLVRADQAGPSDGPAWTQEGNALCPVLTDEPVDPDKFTDYERRRIYFCCSKCLRKFLASPTSYLRNLPEPPAPPGALNSAPSEAAPVPDASKPQIHGEAEQGGQEKLTGHHRGTEHEVSTLERFVNLAGRFHPLVVHFPIALLVAAAVGELLSIFRSAPWLSEAARYCLLFGALSAIAAALLCWARALSGDFPSGLAHTVHIHGWFGVGTAVWMNFTALFSELARVHPPNPWMARYRLLLFAGTALIAVTGHLGATITHGSGYYAW